ncbi:MAG: transporter substrate-binding domain-containing protein [Chelatococcus sp.]|jgi:polar amino acid transport system substrate-binding protein|uniref:transporter substrate-binding domain-containing protein n=1 Tax=unclassified Chelatococcus TaxID=2638111 RepID=UPI001BCC4C51|nr:MULTISPECIES: transporter substrate-binding domain-containing protein [unclassified Chelatococcus]CAH1670738.1 Amino acid ABC transporter substrate-binding protein (PAAT family) [Hyphomicrobiales bacterium]MBS7739164.1 transporter substrate-binding domain-containing protein [Chelatococcus sp. HY11]MBX3536960.1 transporter substrate-binding domain-containing protein [Chelatococcus sp.]MBX3543654.1 transporter substrate-binding domain-containing protein [Chelatococcus sp.]MCO5076304.1 transpo
MLSFKTFKYAIAALALGVAAVGATSQASAQTVQDIVKRGKARIGVLIGAPPYGSVDAQGNAVGYDADVTALIGKYLGVPVEIVQLTPPSRIPALESGKVDFLVATLAPTPERARSVLFTIPYSMFQPGIYAHKNANITKWEDLKGKKVGVNRGSSVEHELTSREKDLNLQIMRFEDDATVMMALFTGQVDAIAGPDAQANAAMKARNVTDYEQKFIFARQPNSMTVRKDQTDLRDWLNNVIYYIKLNGELDAVSRKWVGTPLPELPVF